MLRTFITSHTRAPTVYHKHIVTGVLIDLDGDCASGESYFLRVDERQGAPLVVAAGRYRDEYIRAPDQRWRFKYRLAEIEARLPAD
jgi:hypothetical protein